MRVVGVGQRTWESILSFHHAAPKGQGLTWAVRLRGRCVCLLRHRTRRITVM